MRCTYIYPDNGQCIAKAPDGKTVCDAHTLLTQMTNNQKRQDEKKKEKQKTAPAAGRVLRKKKKKAEQASKQEQTHYDHSAPWRCSLADCEKCGKKPSYAEYMSRYNKEQVNAE